MPRPSSPQLRFLTRASLLLLALLALWWFVLLDPMLGLLRISAGLAIRALPGADATNTITVDAAREWELRLPMPSANPEKIGATPLPPAAAPMKFRSIRLTLPPNIPNLLTLSLPLFWAVILAAPRARRLWRILVTGTAALVLIAPLSLLACAAHRIRVNLYPSSSHLLGSLLAFASYLSIEVIPYMAPVLLAVSLHRELRTLILSGEPALPPHPEEPSVRKSPKSGRGRYRIP